MVKPMYVDEWRHTGIQPNGVSKTGGAVNVKAKITYSAPGGGCGMKGCNCSPGHWICIGKARTSAGVVAGKTLHFMSRKDLLEYKKEHKLR